MTSTAVGADPAELLTIGQASQRLALSPRSLRYYEELGLLTPAGKTEGGHRLYAEDDLARVGRIRELQELMGFDLTEIRGVLDVEDRLAALRSAYHSSGQDDERRRVAAEALELHADLLARIDAKVERLLAFRASVEERRARARRAARRSAP